MHGFGGLESGRENPPLIESGGAIALNMHQSKWMEIILLFKTLETLLGEVVGTMIFLGLKRKSTQMKSKMFGSSLTTSTK
jgi:hypothetical protein